MSYYPICNNCEKQVYIAPKGDVTACGKTEGEQWDFHNLHYCKPDWKLRAEEYQARIKDIEIERDELIDRVKAIDARCNNLNAIKSLEATKNYYRNEAHKAREQRNEVLDRAEKAEARAKELESKIEKAINYVDEYLVHGDEGLMNEMKDAMMMEDES